jgi:hypothetical protein
MDDLIHFFEALEDEEEEDELGPEYDLDAPMPGYALVKRVMLQMAKDNQLPAFFADCSSNGSKTFPIDADDLDLMMLKGIGNTQIYEIMLRNVPPLLDLAFPNLVLRFIFHDSPDGNIDVVIACTHKSSDVVSDPRAIALFKDVARYHKDNNGELVKDPIKDSDSF